MGMGTFQYNFIYKNKQRTGFVPVSHSLPTRFEQFFEASAIIISRIQMGKLEVREAT